MISPQAALYTAAQVRELDRVAIEEGQVPGIQLMKRAGRSAFELLREIHGDRQPVTVYCGAGNNGGDGYIVAALAAAAAMPVTVIQVADESRLTGDARTAWELAVREGVAIEPFASATPPRQGVIVDALLGTGLSGDVRGAFAAAIDQINRSGLPVLAIDIPSGLCADTGRVLGDAVSAEATITFIGKKRGLFTGKGPTVCGEVFFDDLDVPEMVYHRVSSPVRFSEWPALRAALPARPADAHKGLYGHVMVIGGELGYGGAAALAAEAALRAGAGLVSVATRAEHVAGINARCPEVMAIGVASGQALEPLLARPSVLVVGPGLGRTPWSEQMLQKALAAGLPMVLDADALNILAEGRVGRGADLSGAVVTPHPGEAARLLGCTTGDIQGDRFAAVARLRERLSATVLLKGVGTLVAGDGGTVSLCPHGNPGMATGGMGDVLSGIIGALLAQGMSQGVAAEAGACLHGLAGDRAATLGGQVGMTASDLIAQLRGLVNGGPDWQGDGV